MRVKRRTIDQTVWHTACPMAPPMKITSAMPRTGFRPRKSLSMPATKPPRSAPSVVEDVMSSCSVRQMHVGRRVFAKCSVTF